jgi:hypothetical protein
VTAAVFPANRDRQAGVFPPPRPALEWPTDPERTDAARNSALRHAKVWQPVDAVAADLSSNPPDPSGLLSEPIVRCRFLPRPPRGTTPKFDCVLGDGEVVKVKYGHNLEIPGEVAGTRLLTALGFGADRIYLVPRMRCYGCPRLPFYAMLALDPIGARDFLTRRVSEDRYTDFEWVAAERKFDGLEISGKHGDGWAWYELDAIDPSRGATRAEVDALRLTAMLLAHWDNKAANQRLVCLAPPSSGTEACPRPFAIIQDLGSTFGPKKINLRHWRTSAIWTDASRCTVSMKAFPYGGATFPDRQISEAGRQLIARQLSSLTERQLLALFSAAHFPEFAGADDGHDVNAWVATFRDKVRQIADAGPCPS